MTGADTAPKPDSTLVDAVPKRITCRHCRKRFDPSRWIVRDELIQKRLCLQDWHWDHLANVASERPSDVVRVGGCHYMIEAEPDKTRPRWRDGMVGHGGAGCMVKFFDGREVLTHNLWSQGEIPESWRAALPDNATLEWMVAPRLDLTGVTG